MVQGTLDKIRDQNDQLAKQMTVQKEFNDEIAEIKASHAERKVSQKHELNSVKTEYK